MLGDLLDGFITGIGESLIDLYLKIVKGIFKLIWKVIKYLFQPFVYLWKKMFPTSQENHLPQSQTSQPAQPLDSRSRNHQKRLRKQKRSRRKK